MENSTPIFLFWFIYLDGTTLIFHAIEKLYYRSPPTSHKTSWHLRDSGSKSTTGKTAGSAPVFRYLGGHRGTWGVVCRSRGGEGSTGGREREILT